MSLVDDLAARAVESAPIRIGLIGCGEMGTDIVTQVALMPGLEIAVLAEMRIDVARAALTLAGIGADHVQLVETVAAAEAAISAGKLALTQSADIACTAGQVDVIIDATGNPGYGAELSIRAMDHGKHVVMMNVEADITVGASLAAHAAKRGVVYSLGAGDEPSAIMELMGFARSLGYPIVAAGKGKNNPLNFDAIPADYAEEAARRHMNPRMLVEFVDGSKTMIEMVAVANATGLLPDVAGMHGPAASLADLPNVFRPRSEGGLLSRSGVVDYSIGAGVAPGVFVIIKAPHPRVHERLRDLKMGEGPYFTFYRPYHLTSLEVPLTAAAAVLYRRPHMTPLHRPVAEVATLAKRDLTPGTVLGKIGEADYRGWAMTAEAARAADALPIGLAERAVVTSPIARGAMLTYANCRPDQSMDIVRLRGLQDAALGYHAQPLQQAG
ncbi:MULTISPECIES: NAD(P)H-dependent oxidoreductase [Acidiphilium]|uniref:Predicted homoserine dehydrogenase, contains C-terminal SAF domain n=1 Tax=Acidiphilium rubrum TaxID=526 RepID=A0A8G2CLA5_ACIRU|nr:MULTISPECIES: homoserine dehydrogenase [Acidiphilium]MBW4035720.1 homoserine dehydrogenase [Pseudomonadota bacterium]SIQ69243.1 Predicted homoserine dehydrogenase, contains C-terminal SAF domain [Acidiphilium rubrum]